MPSQYLNITWQDYHALAQKLATAVLQDRSHIDEIVAISRGGLTLGHMMTDLLRLPISVFSIQSYSDIKTQGEITVTEPFTRPIAGKHILLVDDVSDTGKTFHRAIEHLEGLSPGKITTLSMYYKPHSAYRPHYFARKTDKWIIFPYEPTEMIGLLTDKLENEGKTKIQIQDFLTDIGFHIKQIAFVRKHHRRKP